MIKNFLQKDGLMERRLLSFFFFFNIFYILLVIINFLFKKRRSKNVKFIFNFLKVFWVIK